MKRPRPSKNPPSSDRAVGPGLLIPAGLAGAVGANGCSPGPDGLGASPAQAGPASDATDPDGPDSISGGMPAVRRNGAVSCMNDPVAVSRIGAKSSKVGRFAAPQRERRGVNLAEGAPAFLTPVQEAPCEEVSCTSPPTELPNGVGPMTWMKARPEVFEQMAGDCLSRDAMLAHLEGMAYLYRTERMDCRIARAVIRNIMFGFDDPTATIRELVRAGYWSEHDTYFELVDHRNTIRESLTAQNKKRERDAGAQQKRRDRQAASVPSSVTDADTDDATTQSNNQTTNHAVREGSHLKAVGQCRTCDYGDPPTPDGRCQHCVDWDVKEIAS